MSAPAAPATQQPSLGAKLLRRAAIAIVLILIMLVPAFALMGITGQVAATYSALGALVGIVAALAAGTRVAVVTVIVASLLAPIAIVAGLSPVTGAALMAVMTLTIGRMSMFGLHRATMLVPIMLAWPMLAPMPWLPHDQIARLNELLTRHGTSLADALTTMQAKGAGEAASATSAGSGGASGAGDALAHMLTQQRMDSTYLAWVALFFFIGAIIPVLLAPLARKRMPVPAHATHTRAEAMPYTITITVLTSAATFYFLSNPKVPGGAFMIATILVLAQVGNETAWRLTIERVLGTLGGVVLFIAITYVVGGNTFVEFLGLPFPLKIYLIGILFGVVAVMAKFGKAYWPYYVLIVPTTAFLNAFTVGQATSLGEARLIDNVVGAAAVVLAALITMAASRILAKRPAPAEAPVATA